MIEKVYCLLVGLTASYFSLESENGKIENLKNQTKNATSLR